LVFKTKQEAMRPCGLKISALNNNNITMFLRFLGKLLLAKLNTCELLYHTRFQAFTSSPE